MVTGLVDGAAAGSVRRDRQGALEAGERGVVDAQLSLSISALGSTRSARSRALIASGKEQVFFVGNRGDGPLRVLPPDRHWKGASGTRRGRPGASAAMAKRRAR
jgi:hypothetical protein